MLRARILVGLIALAIVVIGGIGISSAVKKSAERKAQKEQELKQQAQAEAEKENLVSPFFPFLVVIRMTPFDARVP